MKKIIVISAGLTVLSGIILTIQLILSSFWLSVIVVSILIVLAIGGIFSLGAWKREKDIEKWLMAGVKLARDEHEIVSRYDDGIVKAFSGFANQILKTKADSIEISRPALPNAMPSGFIIEGLKPKQLIEDIEELDD